MEEVTKKTLDEKVFEWVKGSIKTIALISVIIVLLGVGALIGAILL